MDRHIDNKETQKYGTQFSGNVRRMFGEGTPGPLVAFMLWCAEQLDASTVAIGDAMAAERGAGSTRSATAEEKLPAVKAARGEIKALALHVAAKKADAHEAWKGDPALFVPGGLTSIGKGARAVHLALGVARTAVHDDPAVPERAKWIKRLDAQLKSLAPLVERTDGARQTHNATLAEQSVEKVNWLRTYRGLVLVLEGVLMMTGRDGEYTAAVPHLNAPGGPRKTDGVPDVPAVTPQPSQTAKPA